MKKITSWVVNLVGKLTGANAVLKKVNGYKAYLGGAAGLLTGLAGILTGVVDINTAAEALAFAKGLPSNPHWLTMIAGWTAIALRHAQGKK